MLSQMSLRDRIFALLLGAIVLGAASSAVSLWALDKVARRGQEAARLEIALSQTLGRVAADHLGQTAALERALWEARPDQGASAGEKRFEDLAAAIWEQLQTARSLLETAQSERSTGELVEPLAKLDQAHNDYAERARAVLTALASGRRDQARALTGEAEAASQIFQSALGAVLVRASERAESELAALHEEQRRAMLLVGLLTAGGLLAGGAVLLRAVQLVSRIRSLSGLLPICATCKSIRDVQGYWNQLESFVEDNSEAQFTHSFCEPCVEKLKAETKAA